MTSFTYVCDDNSSVKAEETLMMERSQKFSTGTKSGGSKVPLNGLAFTSNIEGARTNRVLHGRSAILFKVKFLIKLIVLKILTLFQAGLISTPPPLSLFALISVKMVISH